MILADEMVAVLDELLHPQCRETSVTATTGGGQRDVNLLTLYLRRGCTDEANASSTRCGCSDTLRTVVLP